MKKVIIFGISLLLCSFQGNFAQELYRVDPTKSTIYVAGTSSLHDWEMKAEKLQANMKIIKESQAIRDITEVSFSLRSKDIMSDNSIMNSKTQDALKADKYQQIKFDLESVSGLKFTSGNFSGVARGNLFIAGKTKLVEIPFHGKVNGNQSLVISGNENLRMSDFGIDPPTAMLGTLKTGDEVNIKFDLEFIQ